jgi:hypothetical protein
VVDPDELRRAVVRDACVGERCRMEPVASAWCALAEVAGRYALVMGVFDRAFQMQPLIEESLTRRGSDQILLAVAVGRRTTLSLRFETLESLVGDEVDNTANRIRTV